MKLKKKKTRPFRQRFATILQCITKPRKAHSLPDKPFESIAILAKERFGDSIMLTPLIKCLRRAYPELSIIIITFNQIIFDFFSADTNVTAVYHTKKNIARYYHMIFTKKFDLLFNPKDHPSTNFLIQSMLIHARYKIGLLNTFHEGLYDQLISLAPDTHESVKNLALMSVINSTAHHNNCKPYLPPMPVSSDTTAFLNTLAPGRYLGINISAGHGGGHRTLRQWSELIESFPNETFVIFSSPQDFEEKRTLEQQHTNILPSPSTGNLYEVGEIVKRLKCLITPDTSLVHVASCSNTPLIGLYRNSLTDHNQFGPLSTLKEVMVSPTPDVVDIDSKTVTDAVRNMLKNLS